MWKYNHVVLVDRDNFNCIEYISDFEFVRRISIPSKENLIDRFKMSFIKKYFNDLPIKHYSYNALMNRVLFFENVDKFNLYKKIKEKSN